MMADDTEKRSLLGLEDDEPLPRFGKRKVRPPVTESEKQERKLEEFRDEARALLQEGRERSNTEQEEVETAGKKASLLRFFRDKSLAAKPEEPDAEPDNELSEEEEWHRRMSGQSASPKSPASDEDAD